MSQPPPGTQRRRRMQGPKSEELMVTLDQLDERVAGWVDEFVFGEVWERDGLGEADRLLVAITALASLGRTNQLRTYLFGALHAGESARRIHEALVMLTVYAGFPAALDALATWCDVLASARRQGVSTDLD
jgi:4-carboxymuconolactone decarboxylase